MFWFQALSFQGLSTQDSSVEPASPHLMRAEPGRGDEGSGAQRIGKVRVGAPDSKRHKLRLQAKFESGSSYLTFIFKMRALSRCVSTDHRVHLHRPNRSG